MVVPLCNYRAFKLESVMEILQSVLALVVSIIVLFVLYYFVRIIFSRVVNKKYYLKRFGLALVVFFLAMVPLGIVTTNIERQEAIASGYESLQDYQEAKKEGITNIEDWKAFQLNREQILADRAKTLAASKARKAAEDKKRREEERLLALAEEKRLADEAEAERIAQIKARQAKEEACRLSLECWGEKAWSSASFKCTSQIERFARYDHEWTDGILEPKFSHYRWQNKETGVVTVIGDKIKMQNGFGAWMHMTYECDVNPANNIVLDVRVREGRLR